MTPAGASAITACPADPQPAILIVDSDSALFGLIEEWLVACGFKVLRKTNGGAPVAEQVGLVILDLPFPRDEISSAIRNITTQYPGIPIVALSSTFFPGVASHGTVAQSLGVSAVIAKPLKRDAFIAAVTKLL
jgi:CheY-like chemotaxis protein